MEPDLFLRLPTREVAALVRERRPQLSCGMPLNGTRRWFALRQRAQPGAGEAQASEGQASEAQAGEAQAGGAQAGDPLAAYIAATLPQQIAVHRLLYEHGVHTIVYPIFGGELLGRGAAYNRALLSALEHIATHPALRAFYDEWDIRVRMYGDYARAFDRLGYPHMVARYADVMQATAAHTTRRLLYGLWAEDAAEAAAAYGARGFAATGRTPARAELLQAYYGVALDWLDCYIGFEKSTVFDVPWLLGPDTALYFTVAPSLGLTQPALRAILYDLLFARAADDPDALRADAAHLRALGAYYAAHADEVLGAGRLDPRLGVWVPVQAAAHARDDKESAVVA